MELQIKITIGELSLLATLNDSITATRISEALPIEGLGNVWGEEIYFSIPVAIDEAEDARQEMAVGELGYWPSGSAFCIFFGPTPVSTDDLPRAFSNVNPFGKIEGDATVLRRIANGEIVLVENFK
jgi:hypothetical protein